VAFKSYARHAEQEERQAGALRLPSCYTDPDSVDAWRHRRMHAMLLPLIESDPDATWMTVGDGSFGSDAYFLEQQGVDVLATSLTDASLKVAHEKGFIRKYAAVNAEKIPYPDDSFDYVLCKEAYHHFPRPSIAFYEMLRVARKGVVLIEPYDGPPRLLDMVKEPMKKLLWGKNQTIHFEPSGNYIYRIHPKEIAKKLAAVGCPALAWKTFNDICLRGVGKAKAGRSIGYIITLWAIIMQDLASILHLINPGLTTIVAFKKIPSQKSGEKLRRACFLVHRQPSNPYLVARGSDA
jgi:SAM-dependent methyltransferase